MQTSSQAGLLITGEAHCDTEGAVHGWCWAPDMPAARIKVELLIRGIATRTVVASRFREDLRERGIGDGYHAFTFILPPDVYETGGRAHAALRAVGHDAVFWQMNALSRAIDDTLKTSIQRLNTAIQDMAGAISQLERARQTDSLARNFARLAERLRVAGGRA